MCVCVSGETLVDSEAGINPFHAHGELRRKADFIITHSRISRTELVIADPDDVDDHRSAASAASNISSRAGASNDQPPADSIDDRAGNNLGLLGTQGFFVVENAGVENAGVENVAPECTGGKLQRGDINYEYQRNMLI